MTKAERLGEGCSRRRPVAELRNICPSGGSSHASAFDHRPAGSSGGARVSAPVEVPEDMVERVRTLCLALPEVTVRVDESSFVAR